MVHTLLICILICILIYIAGCLLRDVSFFNMVTPINDTNHQEKTISVSFSAFRLIAMNSFVRSFALFSCLLRIGAELIIFSSLDFYNQWGFD